MSGVIWIASYINNIYLQKKQGLYVRGIMTENQFWELIQASLDDLNEGLYQHESLRKILLGMESQKIAEFDQIYQRLFDKAYTGEVWAASLLLNGGFSSDDGFKYFRDWLISCGKQVYSKGISNPDSLAEPEVQEEVFVDENGFSIAQYEDFGSVAWEAYEEKTGGDINEQFVDENEPTELDWDSRTYEDSNWLQQNLPNLWSLFGEKIEEHKNQSPIESLKIQQVHIENLGDVIVGEKLLHPEFGEGELLNILNGGVGITAVEIEFKNYGRKHLVAQNANLSKLIQG